VKAVDLPGSSGPGQAGRVGREAGQDHPRVERVRNEQAAGRSGQPARRETRIAAPALSADARRDRRGEELDRDLSRTHRLAESAHKKAEGMKDAARTLKDFDCRLGKPSPFRAPIETPTSPAPGRSWAGSPRRLPLSRCSWPERRSATGPRSSAPCPSPGRGGVPAVPLVHGPSPSLNHASMDVARGRTRGGAERGGVPQTRPTTTTSPVSPTAVSSTTASAWRSRLLRNEPPRRPSWTSTLQGRERRVRTRMRRPRPH
jgi:hypothetical protein